MPFDNWWEFATLLPPVIIIPVRKMPHQAKTSAFLLLLFKELSVTDVTLAQFESFPCKVQPRISWDRIGQWHCILQQLSTL